MTGVINVAARLPAVIFPVVIRPSGGLTPLISLSVSLVYLCLSVSLCCSALSLSLLLYIFSVLLQLYLYSYLLKHSLPISTHFSCLPYYYYFRSLSSTCSPSQPVAPGHFIHLSVMETHWCMQPFCCSNMLIREIWSLIYGWVNIPLN